VEELKLEVGGMHCAACVRRVTAALGKVPGVAVESVEIGSARVQYEPGLVNPARIAEAVEKIGFTAKSS
jgi:copper chaperone CopZ